jgi:predicted CopG family antitoxin
MFDDMIPWERDVHIAMIIKNVEEDNEKEKLKQQERRARRAAGRR